MHGLGSTIMATHWPRFLVNGVTHTLPRPYKKCQPNGVGWFLMKESWFCNIVNLLEKLVFQYLDKIDKNEHTLQVISDLKKTKSIVPESLRISNSIFTQMTITTSNGSQNMATHVDDGDIIGAVINLGEVTNGGATLYFDKKDDLKKGKCSYRIDFEHGRIQIGFFDKVYHCVESFEGVRFGLNFNVKKDVLRHFEEYGTKYYNQLIDNDYDGELFLAR